jgi:hypothetical protein
MREVLDQLEGLIQFQGLNFRSTSIDCKHCGWSGTGGSLEVPGLAASGEPVVYACPACMEVIAVHNGLTDQEVMHEMEKIRQILSAEAAAETGGPAQLAGAHVEPDYAAIRAQLPMQVDAEAAEGVDEAELALAGAADDQVDESNRPVRQEEPAQDLDFESVRARLGAIA